MNRTLLRALTLVAGAVLIAGSAPARAADKPKVACTLSTIESLVHEIGGDKVDAFSLSAGDQDPHFVSPTPSLMKKVREADLLLEIGMQLELWADEVANGSGNPRIFKGAKGRIALSTGIPKLEVPDTLSRAQGDIHPEGNPHLWLDPVRAKMMAANVAAALKTVDPEDGATFDARLKDFQARVDKAFFGDPLLEIVGSKKLSRLALDGKLGEFLDANDYNGKKLSELAGGWLAKAKPLRGSKVLEFHKVWVYFARAFNIKLAGTIEERPGIPPGPQHVRQITQQIKAEKIPLILVDNFYDPALPNNIGRETGAHVVVIPNQVDGEPAIKTYFDLMDHLIREMTTALAK